MPLGYIQYIITIYFLCIQVALVSSKNIRIH